MWMLVLGMWGCDRDRTIPFPEGLTPIDMENTARWPADMTEAINTTSGVEAPYTWAHARGYIHSTLASIYACMQESEINLDRRQDVEWTRVEDVEEGYEHSYRLDILVHSIVDVEFSDTWRHGSSLDEQGAITEIRSRWKMTEGNDFMFLKEGSIVSATPEAGWTSLDIVGHIDVAQGDEETMISYITDMYTDIVACVSGSTYPSFE